MLPSPGAQAAAAHVGALPGVATEQIRSACMYECGRDEHMILHVTAGSSRWLFAAANLILFLHIAGGSRGISGA